MFESMSEVDMGLLTMGRRLWARLAKILGCVWGGFVFERLDGRRIWGFSGLGCTRCELGAGGLGSDFSPSL
jgi:hypothetical protein